MQIILLVIHILISIALVLIILAQTSKGNGLDSNLGGAASNVFGSSASDMMKKWTQIIGGLFLISCVFLAITVKSNNGGDAGLAASINKGQTLEDSLSNNNLNNNMGDVENAPVDARSTEDAPESPEK